MPVTSIVCSGASSRSVRSERELSAGTSLTGVTVSTNDWLNVPLSPVVARSPSNPASSTVTVIVTTPCRLAAGVKRMVPVVSADV